MTTTLTEAERREVEQAYAQMLSAAVLLARLLGKPSPIANQDERRRRAAQEETTAGRTSA